VDVTNYVMFECGQPLHAFDFDKLRGGRIVVRRAAEGETMVSIDGAQCKLNPAMLVIADAERPVAVAGIMGASTRRFPTARSTCCSKARSSRTRRSAAPRARWRSPRIPRTVSSAA